MKDEFLNRLRDENARLRREIELRDKTIKEIDNAFNSILFELVKKYHSEKRKELRIPVPSIDQAKKVNVVKKNGKNGMTYKIWVEDEESV